MTEEQAIELLSALKKNETREAEALIKSGRDILEIRKFLDHHFDPPTARALLDCLTARHRFLHKFWRASEWKLNKLASEQASDSRIAKWRARELKKLTGLASLVELGSGIGGDSVFLAENFHLTSYEKDRGRAVLAQSNLEHFLGHTNHGKIRASSGDSLILSGELLFCDPARRASGNRISRPEEWLPPLPKLIQAFTEQRFQAVAIKCAPGLSRDHLGPLEHKASLYYLSINGALKECFAFFHQGEPRTKALLFSQWDQEPQCFEKTKAPILVREPKPGLFLHNPDPAILRAEALDSLSAKLDSGIVHPKIAYLVGATPSTTRAAISFKILEAFPLKWPDLKRRLSASGWSEYEYLGRGVPFSQPDVRKKIGPLKLKKHETPRRGSIIMYRKTKGYQVLFCERVKTVD